MSSQQRDTLDQLLRAGPLDLGGDLAEQRPLLDALMTSHPLKDDVSTTRTTIGGVPAVDIRIAGRSSNRVVLYFHGGAYALGTAAAAAGLASDLARHADARAVSVDYRLAPENPYPAGLDDAVAAYVGLLDVGIPAAHIAFAGESAGAGLATAALVRLHRNGHPMPAAAVLMSPWADLTLTGDSLSSKAAIDPALTRRALSLRADDYGAGQDLSGELISPVFADLRGLPPLLIQAGSHEILLDDATRLAARAAADEVAVTLSITPGVPHGFQGFSAVIEEAGVALQSAGAFLRQRWDVDVPDA